MSEIWHEAWLAARSGAPPLFNNETLLGGPMSRDYYYGDQPGPGPAPADPESPCWPHNGYHGGPDDCRRSGCPCADSAAAALAALPPEPGRALGEFSRLAGQVAPLPYIGYLGPDGRLVPAKPAGHGEHCGCGPCQAAASWEEFWDTLCEPLGLPDEALPSYETAPAGTCMGCHRGPVYKDGWCLYCHRLVHPLREPACGTCGREGSHARSCRRACRVPAADHPAREVASSLRWMIALAVTEAMQPRTMRRGRCTRCRVPAGHVHTRKCQNASLRHGFVTIGLAFVVLVWFVMMMHGLSQ